MGAKHDRRSWITTREAAIALKHAWDVRFRYSFD